MKNQSGQVMIEVLIVGIFSFVGLYLLLLIGLNIINTTLEKENIEQKYVCEELANIQC